MPGSAAVVPAFELLWRYLRRSVRDIVTIQAQLAQMGPQRGVCVHINRSTSFLLLDLSRFAISDGVITLSEERSDPPPLML